MSPIQVIAALIAGLTAFSVAVQASPMPVDAPMELDAPVELNARSGTKLTQAQAASKLKAAGISASSSGGCTSKSNPSCTSYDGVYSGTVDGAITLKKACGCDVLITGGTETGHASGTYSHANGYKFDFHKNTKLNNYIKNTFTKIGTRGDGYPQWKSAAGNVYCVSLLIVVFVQHLTVLVGRGKPLGRYVLLNA